MLDKGRGNASVPVKFAGVIRSPISSKNHRGAMIGWHRNYHPVKDLHALESPTFAKGGQILA
jgi:hypothetical protein